MKKIFVFSAAIAGMSVSITAGNCSQYWAKTYGGSDTDRVYSMHPVSGGGYIMAGDTVSFDDNNWTPLTIRLDVDGNILWSKLYVSTLRNHFAVVQQTSDGGYITGGYNHPSTGNGDALILKLDSLGDVSWVDIAPLFLG